MVASLLPKGPPQEPERPPLAGWEPSWQEGTVGGRQLVFPEMGEIPPVPKAEDASPLRLTGPWALQL